MSEGSSILRETGCRLKNQLLHCIRLRADDFPIRMRAVSTLRDRGVFSLNQVKAGATTAYRVYV